MVGSQSVSGFRSRYGNSVLKGMKPIRMHTALDKNPFQQAPFPTMSYGKTLLMRLRGVFSHYQGTDNFK